MPGKQNVIASYAHCSRLCIPIRRALLWSLTQSFQISQDNLLLMHHLVVMNFGLDDLCLLLSIRISISTLY